MQEEKKNSQQESEKGRLAPSFVYVCISLPSTRPYMSSFPSRRFNAERPRQMSPCAQTPYTRRANTGIASNNRNQSIFNMNKE